MQERDRKEEEVLKKYAKICTEDPKEFMKKYNENGLSSSEAERKYKKIWTK